MFLHCSHYFLKKELINDEINSFESSQAATSEKDVEGVCSVSRYESSTCQCEDHRHNRFRGKCAEIIS